MNILSTAFTIARRIFLISATLSIALLALHLNGTIDSAIPGVASAVAGLSAVLMVTLAGEHDPEF